MSTVVGFHPLTCPVELGPLPDDSVRSAVWDVLAGLFPPGKSTERRADQRFPFPHLFYLTPLDDQGRPLVDESVAVVGKHLSERGLGFFYHRPLAHRRMIASLELRDGRWTALVIDLTWCRFTRHGWYDSGGRFLEAVESPIALGGH